MKNESVAIKIKVVFENIIIERTVEIFRSAVI